MLLADTEKRGLAAAAERLRTRRQPQRAAADLPPAARGRAEHDPGPAQLRRGERIGDTIVARVRLARRDRPQRRRARRQRHRLSRRQDDRPAAAPADRQQEGLAARVVVEFPTSPGPRGEEHRPPVARGRLDQVGMPRLHHRIGARRIEIELREDRLRRRAPGSGERVGTERDFVMAFLGAALRTDQQIAAVLAEQVRPLDPEGMACRIGTAVDDHAALAGHGEGVEVDLLQPDRAMPVIARRALGRAIVDHPGTPVGVEEERRIDAFERQPVLV